MRKVTTEALEYAGWRGHLPLSLAERIVLYALAWHAEPAPKDGPWRWKVTMTGEQLSDLSGVSLRHTAAVTKQLSDAGLLERVLGTFAPPPAGREAGTYFFGPR